MTPQERDLLIAKAMGLENVRKIHKWIKYNNGLIDVVWNPSENAEQREMIEDWVVEQGHCIDMQRNKTNTFFGIDHIPDVGYLVNKQNHSKSEAFLEAVGELCQNKLNKKED